MINLEDTSRRNNLKIYRVTETDDETWEKCEEQDEQIFSENLCLKNIRVERAHRVKKGKGDKSKKQ